MPYTKENLATIHGLSKDQVDQALSTAKLPLEQPEYTDKEIEQRFKPVVADLFGQELAQLPENQANGKSKKSLQAKSKGLQDNRSTSANPTSESREQLLEKIQALVGKVGGLSAEEFAQLLPDLHNQRQEELIELFDRGLLSGLSQMVNSGELEQRMRQSAEEKKSLTGIPSLFLEAEVIEESSSPHLLSESSNNKSSS